MNDRSRTALLFLLIVAVSFAAKAGPALMRARLTPDAVAYCNIARNLAAGHGFTSNLKLNYRDTADVTHPAMSDWPPLYPLLAGTVLRLGGDERSLQLANALFVSVAAGFVFLIGTKLFGRKAGLIGGAVAMLAPNLLRAGIVPMSDALALMLSLAAIVLIIVPRPRLAIWLFAGVLAAAAALARYPSAVVVIAVILYCLTRGNPRRFGIASVTSFACVFAPVCVWQWATQGCQMQAIHYGVTSFSSAMWNLHTAVDPWYALHHPFSVGIGVSRNAVLYAIDLLSGSRGLSVLSIGLLAWLLRGSVGKSSNEAKLMLTIAALNSAVYALTWSIPAVRGSRFLLLSYCLLLPFCATGLLGMLRDTNVRVRFAGASVCLAAVAIYAWGAFETVNYRGGECKPLSPSVSRSIAEALPPGTNVASNNPWLVNYSTGLPTALLPRDLGPNELERFVHDFNIGRIVIVGQHYNSRTADSISQCCASGHLNQNICLISVARRDYGQNAYEGKWKMMPHIVQKLPSTHSPSMIPRKNGSARL